MNSLVALLLLGQIIGSALSHHFAEQADCNSKEAEHWADLAVQYINEHNLHGYKQALNVIKDLHVAHRRPHGDLVHLEIEVLETTCHVLDSTPAKNCSLRGQHAHAVAGDCDVKLLSDESVTKVIAVRCHSEPDSVEDMQKHCPKCSPLLPLNDHHVVESVEYVLQKLNEKNPGNIYEVLEISRGQHKHEPESFYLEFAIVEINCTAQEAHDDHEHCHPKEAKEAHTGFCKATIFRSHDAQEKPKDEKFESDCVIFDAKEGHSHTHLIEHHLKKHVTSPAQNHTVLDLAHSHNHTDASHESHSHENVENPAASVVKRASEPIDPPHPVKLCPGKTHHFKL